MNYLGACCFLALVASLSAQNEPQFSEIIAEAQNRALQLHVDFEAQLDALRWTVSDHLTTLSEGTLTVLLEATEETRRLSDRCLPIPSITIQITQLSAQLSQCALQSDQQINTLTGDYFNSLVLPQAASVALLSGVLDYVGRSNPVDSPAQIATDMEASLQALREEFANTMLPPVQTAVDAIAAGALSVPQFTRDCVDTMLQQINTVASQC